MAKPLFEQTLADAFENKVGEAGESQQRYQHWLDALVKQLPAIKEKPQREAAPVFHLPSQKTDIHNIEEIARTISDHFETLLVVGMGGSSLSGETLAAIHKPGRLKLRFIDNIDPHGIELLCESIDWLKTAALVISKSGNTVETLAQISVLMRRAKMELGSNISRHFYILTIHNDNPLHAIAKANGMKLIPHDPDLGGRFSILSAVGLIPAAAIGMDIRALRAGALRVLEANFAADAKDGSAVQSAALHMALMEKNVRINVMMHYCDRLGGLASWYRQCWGESLGKCAQATTPVRSRGTTDQHSQLQLYLDGPRDKIFSMMMLDSRGKGDPLEFAGSTDKRLDFLKGRTMGDLMVAEQMGTLSTLVKRGCPVRGYTMKTLNEEVLGALLMHFSLEVIFTAALLSVNAFDQPAVEDSKVLAMQYLSNKAA